MDLLEGVLRCMGGKVNACMHERLYRKRKYKTKKKNLTLLQVKLRTSGTFAKEISEILLGNLI